MSDKKTEDWLGLKRPRTQVQEARLEGLESPPEEEQDCQASHSFRGKRGEPMLDLTSRTVAAVFWSMAICWMWL